MAERAERAAAVDNLRVPPNSVEAEQAVLGGLMLSNQAWDRIADRLVEDDFYRRDHRLIFRAVAELAEKGQPFDVVTLREWLDARGEIEPAGGASYLIALAKDTPSAANITAYADIVREKSVLRQLIDVGTEIAGLAYRPGERESKDLLERAEQQVFRIAEHGARGKSGFIPIKTALNQALERIDELHEMEGSITGVPTGFTDFDRKTAGLQPGDLVIVAGRPSMGKCLSHDSELVLDDGSVVTMAEMYQRREGRVGTLTADLRLSRALPGGYLDDGLKPVFEVVTRLGRRVETTITHPFRTLEGWKPLGEISEGDYVAVPRELPVFGDRPMRECEVKLLAYFIGDGGLTGSSPRFTATSEDVQADFTTAVEGFGGVRVSRTDKRDRAPSFAAVTDFGNIDEARSAVAGAIDQAIAGSGRPARAVAADLGVTPGTISHWRHGATAPDGESLERLCAILQVRPAALAGETAEQARRHRPNPLRSWLHELGLYGHGAHDKCIPGCVFTLPREQLALFLNRLFATDGWASVFASGQSQVGYASVNEKLARQVQHLLLRFGVIAKLRQRWVRYGDARRPSWQLDISHADSLRRFIAEIGIHGKEQALAGISAALDGRRVQGNVDLVPVEVWELLEEAKGDMSWAELARRAGVPGSNIHAHRRSLSRQRLARFAMALQSDELLALANSDVYWDRIESITPLGKKQVYDLTIPETHNFIANDVCVHNTAFSLNLTEYAAYHEKSVGFFSMEMSAVQLVMRLIAANARINLHKLRTGELTEEDWPKLTSAMELYSRMNVFIDETPSLSPNDLRARARRLKRDKGLDMIVVDYLQLMQVPGTRENRATEISEISRGLKALAKELNVPVIALSQLNRSLEQRPNKRPIMSDLRESGSIEQDADVIVFIYRDEVYNEDSPDKGKAEIIIGKQRNGSTGIVPLTFRGEYTRFENFSPDVYATGSFD